MPKFYSDGNFSGSSTDLAVGGALTVTGNITTSSKLGVNTSSPQQTLTANGALFITGALTSPGSAGSYTYNGTAMDYHNNGTRFWSWGTSNVRGGYSFYQLDQDGTSQINSINIDTSGNLTITGKDLKVNNATAINQFRNFYGQAFYDSTSTSYYVNPAGSSISANLLGKIIQHDPAGGKMQLTKKNARLFNMQSHGTGITALTTEDSSSYITYGGTNVRAATALVLGNTPFGATTASSGKDIFNITRVNQASDVTPVASGIGGFQRVLNLRGNGDLYLNYTNPGGSVYGSKFISKASTGYYVDPDSSSQLNTLRLDGVEASNIDFLQLHNRSNGAGVQIKFSDQNQTFGGSSCQHGTITFKHSDTASYGSGTVFILGSDQSTTTILADGKLMYKEGIYSKPSSGTGAGTRKDENWDTAYGWGNHASAGYLASSSYTAADVLSKILTVDGSGSGLDADLLDGQQNTQFLRKLTAGSESDIDTYTDNGLRSLSYTGHSRHLMSFNLGGSPGTTQQEWHYNGQYRFRNKVDNNTWSNWRYVVSTTSNQDELSGTIWHSGNDGANSGLDADTLDGVQGAHYLRSNTTDTASGKLTFGHSVGNLNSVGGAIGVTPFRASFQATNRPGSGNYFTGHEYTFSDTGARAQLGFGSDGQNTVPHIYARTEGWSGQDGWKDWYRLYHTGYHPEADKLTTARTIAGTSFDGSANIDISYDNLTNKPTIPTMPTDFVSASSGGTFLDDITIDGGNSTTLSVKCNNVGQAMVRANGDGQGTGVLEVGQSNDYGGGISYNGDNSPAFVSGESSDHITFYRLDNGTRTEVFHYPYNSSTVNFNVVPTFAGVTAPQQNFDNTGELRAINFKTLNGGNSYFYTSSGSLRGYIVATETDDEHFIMATSGGEDIAFKDGGPTGTTNMLIRGNGDVFTFGNNYGRIWYDYDDTNYYLNPHGTSKTSINIIDGRLTIGQSTDAGGTYRLYSAAGGQVYLGGHTTASSITMSGTLSVTGHYANVGNLDIVGIGNSPKDTGTGGGTGSGSGKLLGFNSLNGSSRASATLGVNDQGIVMEYEKIFTFKISGNGWVNRASNPYKIIQAPGTDKMIVVDEFLVYIDYETRTGLGYGQHVARPTDQAAYSVGFYQTETGQALGTAAHGVSGTFYTLGVMPGGFMNNTADRGYYRDVPVHQSALIANRSLFWKTNRDCNSSNVPGGAHYVKIKYRVVDISDEFSDNGVNHKIDTSSYHGQYAHTANLDKSYNDAGQAVQ